MIATSVQPNWPSRWNATRPPVPQMPGTSLRSKHSVTRVWTTTDSERTVRVAPPSVMARTSIVAAEQGDVEGEQAAGAAGEPHQADAGRGPDETDLLGTDHDGTAEQAGDRVCHQPEHPSAAAQAQLSRAFLPFPRRSVLSCPTTRVAEIEQLRR